MSDDSMVEKIAAAPEEASTSDGKIATPGTFHPTPPREEW